MMYRLTNAEKFVMKCIWDTPKDMVLSEIVNMTNERYQKDWKPQTVSTYLAHLVQKDFLKMTRNGKIYTYHPLVTQEDYLRCEMADLITFWGSPFAAIFVEYYKNDDVDQRALEELKELLAE